MARKTVNAIKYTQNNTTFYVASMSSKTLREMCFVSRKKEEPIKGFQRLLTKTSHSKNGLRSLKTQ